MEPFYKVGDIVKIKQLSEDDDHNYRFGVNDEMIESSGETDEIIDVTPTIAVPGKIPDDGYRYRLKDHAWSWASSMFEESTKSKTEKTKISLHKKKKLKFNFSL